MTVENNTSQNPVAIAGSAHGQMQKQLHIDNSLIFSVFSISFNTKTRVMDCQTRTRN